MIDPLTALTVAKGAFAAIQTGIKLGKGVNDLFGDVSKMWGACGQINKLAANPPRPGLFDKTSAEKLALDAFTAKKEAQRMEHEVKMLVVSEYGPKAWDEIQREIIRIRKEQKAAALAEVARKKRIAKDLMLVGGLVLLAMALFALIIGAAILSSK